MALFCRRHRPRRLSVACSLLALVVVMFAAPVSVPAASGQGSCDYLDPLGPDPASNWKLTFAANPAGTPFYVHEDIANDQELLAEVLAAVDTWQTVAGVIDFAYAGSTTTLPGIGGAADNLNVIGPDGGALASGTLGQGSFKASAADEFEFDVALNFDTSNGIGVATGGAVVNDLQSIVLHELGHVLGLDHMNTPSGLVMNDTLTTGTQNLVPISLDVTCMQNIYGPAPSAEVALLMGLGSFDQSGGYLEVQAPEDPFANEEWLQVPWPTYNAANGETRPVRCDVDGNGQADTVIGLGPGADGYVAVYTDTGTWEWPRIPWPSYRAANGETHVACGDIDNDGRDELVAGLGAGGGGYAYVFDDASTNYAGMPGMPNGTGWVSLGWSGYASEGSGAVHPAVGNLDSDPGAEIALGTAEGGERWLRLLDDASANFDWVDGSGWVRAMDTGSISVTDHVVWPAICDQTLVLGAESASGAGGRGWINTITTSGTKAGTGWFQVPWSSYNDAGGATVPQCGDLDGDGNDEIVVGLTGTDAGGYAALFDDGNAGYAFNDWPRVNWDTYNSAVGTTRPSIG